MFQLKTNDFIIHGGIGKFSTDIKSLFQTKNIISIMYGHLAKNNAALQSEILL